MNGNFVFMDKPTILLKRFGEKSGALHWDFGSVLLVGTANCVQHVHVTEELVEGQGFLFIPEHPDESVQLQGVQK